MDKKNKRTKNKGERKKGKCDGGGGEREKGRREREMGGRRWVGGKSFILCFPLKSKTTGNDSWGQVKGIYL